MSVGGEQLEVLARVVGTVEPGDGLRLLCDVSPPLSANDSADESGSRGASSRERASS